MKTLGILSLVLATSAWAQSPEFPMARLKGLYTYQEHFQISNVRRAETVSLQNSGGSRRIQELRGQGYTCIHKDPRTYLCSKNWQPTEVLPGIEQSVKKSMNAVQVEFEGGDSQPKLVHDGSTTQEWEVSEKVRIMQTPVSIYRVIRNHDGEIFVAFPVNEDQPMSPLRYHGPTKLGLTMVGQSKDTPTSTVAYSIEAFLELESLSGP